MASIVRRLRSGKSGKKKKTRSDTASTSASIASSSSALTSKKSHQGRSSSSLLSAPASTKQIHVAVSDDDCSDGGRQGSTKKPLHLQHSPDASVSTAVTSTTVTPCSSTGDAASDGQRSFDDHRGESGPLRPTRLSYLRQSSFQNNRSNASIIPEGELPTDPLIKHIAVAGSSRKGNSGSSIASGSAANQSGSVSSKRKSKGMKFFRSQSSSASTSRKSSTQPKVPAYIDTTRFLHKSSFQKTTPKSRSEAIAASLNAAKQRPMHSPSTRKSFTRTRSPPISEETARRPESAPTKPTASSDHSEPIVVAPNIASDLPDIPLPDPRDDLKTAQAKARAASALMALKKKEADRIARAAAALDNQGNELFEKGYFDKAMAAYTKALKLKRRTFHTMLEDVEEVISDRPNNENDDSTNSERDVTKDDNSVVAAAQSDPKLLVSMATSINNIGYLRQRSGDATPDETMAAYRKSLRIKRKILGQDDLSVGKTLNNIGSVYYLKRDFPEALSSYSEALQIMESNLGAEHPDVATVWSNIGDVHLGMRNASVMNRESERLKKHYNNEALEHYKQALSIRWSAFGDHDPRVIRLLEKIAAIEMSETGMMSEQSNDMLQDSIMLTVELDEEDLPVTQQLHNLREQCTADARYMDLLQKRMALDMVKDKVDILRGMRELAYQQSGEGSSQLLNYGMGNTSVKSFDYDDHEGAEDDFGSYDTGNDSSSKLDPHHDPPPPPASALSPATPGRYSSEDRSRALKSVKNRLARIRAGRDDDVPHPASSSGPVRGYLGTSLRATDEVETLRSALVLKRGIMSLRSHKGDE